MKCENCGRVIRAGQLVYTSDEIPLHHACALELWPHIKLVGNAEGKPRFDFRKALKAMRDPSDAR